MKVNAILLATVTATAMVLGVLVSGCSEKREVGALDRVSSSGDVRGVWVSAVEYENAHFGLSLEIPADWALKKEDGEKEKKEGLEFIAGDNTRLKAELEESMQRAYRAFSVTKYPEDAKGAEGLANARVGVVVENVSLFPRVRDGSQYLLEMSKVYEMGGRKAELGEVTVETINGVRFFSLRVSLEVNGMESLQKFYAVKKGDYVLLIELSYLKQESLAELEAIINTIQKK